MKTAYFFGTRGPALFLAVMAFLLITLYIWYDNVAVFSKTLASIDSKQYKRCLALKSLEVDVLDVSEPHLIELDQHGDMLKTITVCGGVKPVILSAHFIPERIHRQAINTFKKGAGNLPSSESASKFLVPNVVHYVLLQRTLNSSRQMSFLQYLSFLSVHKFIKPEYIFIHGDYVPDGYWWSRVAKEVANVFHVKTIPPTEIFGQTINHIEQKSDQIRFKVMYEYGGIYLDTDVLAFKSFDPLRNYSFTLGREDSAALASSIILSQPGAAFLRLWFETYRTFKSYEWADHAVRVPNKLEVIYPTLINVDNEQLIRPYYSQRQLLYQTGHSYDWSTQLSCHVFKKSMKDLSWRLQETAEDIENLNSVLGEMMRYVYKEIA